MISMHRTVVFCFLWMFSILWEAASPVLAVSSFSISFASDYDAPRSVSIGYDDASKSRSAYDVTLSHAQSDDERRTAGQCASFALCGRLLAAKGGFQGLDDVTTSSWLGDARIGVTSHLEMFRGGGSFLLPESAYQRFVQGAEVVGRNDGLFITTRGGMDKLLTETGGDLAAINQRLGTFWNEPLWRVDVYNPLLHNARLPSGLEQGANSLFRWGGYTSGGMPEAVLNPVPAGGFSAGPIW